MFHIVLIRDLFQCIFTMNTVWRLQVIIIVALLPPVIALHWTASIQSHSKQKQLLIQDLRDCITDMGYYSLRQQHYKQFHCLNVMLLHCLLRKSTVALSQDIYCGALTMTQRSHPAINQQYYHSAIVLELISSHNIHVHFIRFTFWSSRQYRCEQHGMNVTYAEKTLGTYCGSRVPWTLLIPTHKAYINLTTIARKSYTLYIFYSGLHNDWISNIIQVDTLSCVAPFSIHLRAENFTMKKNTLYFHITTNKTSSLEIFVTSVSGIAGGITIHDGPGPLSEILFEKSESGTSLYKKLRTTAFYAFININMYPTNNSYLFLIKSIRNKGMGCITMITRHRGVLREQSKKSRNVVCINSITFSNTPKGLFILAFHFFGPNQLISSLGIECQYGGLMVEFDNNGKHIELCSNVNKLSLYSGFSITFSLVWFSGYSKGIIISALKQGRCPNFYVELYPPEILYKSAVVFKHDESLSCYQIVCPPLVRAVQRTCNLQLGSVGTAEIHISRSKTLEKCDPILINRFQDFFFDYDLNVSYFNNWPFGPINNTYARYNLSTSVHYFKYLHKGTLRFNLYCKESDPRQQVHVLVKKSSCKVDNANMHVLISQNIPQLSKSCMSYALSFTPREKGVPEELNYHSFIYKDNGDVHTGNDIYLNYTHCSTKCRKYKFVVFVNSAENHTIFEYVSKVGYSISTGYYHRGFRVNLLMPERECAGCHLTITITNQSFPTGTYRYSATIGRRKYILYKNR